jgi:predicted RNA-binding Zn-ribbon protein involved in translation (DUF1610 family)
MSTSTREKGDCTSCGHTMSGHTAAKHSKCGKCGKRVVVCQTGSHGLVHMEGVDATGWRICYVPCYCGEDYYPDTARAAIQLQPWEYKSDHTAYRPVEDFLDGEDDSVEISGVIDEEEGAYDYYQEPGESSSSAAAAAPAEDALGLEEEPEAVPDHIGDLADQLGMVAVDDDEQGGSPFAQPPAVPDEEFKYVDTYLRKGKHVYFMYDELEYKTNRKDWEWMEYEDQRSGEISNVFQNRFQRSFLTWELPSTQRDDDYIEAAENRKGKAEDKGKGKEKEEGKGKGKGKEKEEGKGKGKGKEKEEGKGKDKRKRS